MPDPDALPKPSKPVPPVPPGQGASEGERRDWLQAFSLFDGHDYEFPGEYRAAYRKAKRPADDNERRVQQRRKDPKQQLRDRLGHAGM